LRQQRKNDRSTRGEDDHEYPDTIVLIHGLWLTPRSWEGWIKRYEEAGYTVLARAGPARPRTSRRPATTRRGMNGVGITEITDHYDRDR
jgi:hypothetical protein